MTPAARAQAAIEILDALQSTAQPVDRFMRDWFRQRRYAGSRDRAAVSERIYDIFRHRASYTWHMRSEAPRALVIASLLREQAELPAAFDGSRYGPAPLTEAELHAAAAPPAQPAPLHVQGEYPEWLEPELSRSLGEMLLPEMLAMLSRAPVDLRVNRLRSTREDLLRELRNAGFAAELTKLAPFGLRLDPAAGLSALQNTRLFQDGAFEFQDEGSQIVAHLVDARPGERVLDFAAGAGGKSLALAADMQNQGEVVAFDAFPDRMKPLPDRAARAGINIIRMVTSREELRTVRFDAVLADAPCSGSGTWRRNPDARWRLTPSALDRYRALQGSVLDAAAEHVSPGGSLIYSTCSVLRSENEDAVEAFLSRNRAFRHVAVETRWNPLFSAPVPAGSLHDFHASPFRTGTDGFFASMMQRTG